MPFDRRITLQNDAGMRTDRGRHIPDWQDISTVWAQQRGAGSVDQLLEEGVRTYSSIQYTVRYSPAFAGLDPARTRIIDADGVVWGINTVSESDERRRFVFFQCEDTGARI